MNYEERYYELREAKDRALDIFLREETSESWKKYRLAAKRFEQYCAEILDKLMEENSDVLARLK